MRGCPFDGDSRTLLYAVILEGTCCNYIQLIFSTFLVPSPSLESGYRYSFLPKEMSKSMGKPIMYVKLDELFRTFQTFRLFVEVLLE